MTRQLKLKYAAPAEFIPEWPDCRRCGRFHNDEWYTMVEGEGWVGDPCLTPEEAAKWAKPPEPTPQGKVNIPVH